MFVLTCSEPTCCRVDAIVVTMKKFVKIVSSLVHTLFFLCSFSQVDFFFFCLSSSDYLVFFQYLFPFLQSISSSTWLFCLSHFHLFFMFGWILFISSFFLFLLLPLFLPPFSSLVFISRNEFNFSPKLILDLFDFAFIFVKN